MIRKVTARLGFVLGLGVLGAAAPAAAQEGVAVKNLLGTIGLIPRDKDSIAYRERAPLVVPPKTELRTPGARASASSNAAWPNDPDVAARRRSADEAATPVTWSETRRMSDNTNVRLTPQEIRAGRTAASNAPVPGTHRGDNARDMLLVSPDELSAKRTVSQDEELPAGVEPRRKNLTDPPTGMRKWAGGKAIKGDFAPKIDEQAKDANPINWLTSRFQSEDD